MRECKVARAKVKFSVFAQILFGCATILDDDWMEFIYGWPGLELLWHRNIRLLWTIRVMDSERYRRADFECMS